MKQFSSVFLFINLLFVGISFSQEDTVLLKIHRDNTTNKKEAVYSNIKVMPKFPGGEKGLLTFYNNTSKYKIKGERKGAISVYYSIIINKDGSISEFKILRGNNEKLIKETRRIVSKMPKWKPGKKEGKPVRVIKNLVIHYKNP